MIRKLTLIVVLISLIMSTSAYSSDWPLLKKYDQEHVYKIALPIGGIGTGTVSLGGRGNLQDWEIMNRPAKGYNPGSGRNNSAFFTLYTEADGKKDLRLLEGPVPFFQYEGSSGAVATNHGLPRFKEVSFESAYPFGQVNLRTPQVPVSIKIKAFNPLVPGDVASSSIPVAVLDFELTNTGDKKISVTVCGSMQNFIGEDGSQGKSAGNKNKFRQVPGLSGIYMDSEVVDTNAEQWGNMTLSSTTEGIISYRTAWLPERWASSILDFWDDFSADGKLENRSDNVSAKPMASLAVSTVLQPHGVKTIRFLLTWYFPNRIAWSEAPLKNYYSTQYSDSWDVAEKTVSALPALEKKTVEFVNAICTSDLPDVVKEAALFNISTLRTQTCFRISDGNFFAWEGCDDKVGCCFGTCTHVWNYETATAFLFGDLAKIERNIEFGTAANAEGLMSFRVTLPTDRPQSFVKVAADGQMGCIIKLYRDWQLSGDSEFLKTLYPRAKSALSYAWKKGGWDGNQDGVMEGVQHNTMDVEYYGPNPQMTIWYLGALRAMEEMALYMKDKEMASRCRKLFLTGSKWTDENLFNGEYYIHKIEVPEKESIPKEQLVGMGSTDYGNPDFQLGEGCLVDQLVGQYLAHVCGLGYLVKKENVAKTLGSIMKYNYKSDLSDHFNDFRSFALGDEAALLMASYPKSRPVNPFPYFTEVMTGFEYVAAVGMLYEGQTENGLKCIENIRNRYDGRKRSPFDEAECGHHYGRAMASWSAILALTGFHYSGVTGEMKFGNITGKFFWSDGYSYGTVDISNAGEEKLMKLNVLNGNLKISKVTVSGFGSVPLKKMTWIVSGGQESFKIKPLKYSDNRPACKYRMDATDIGVVLPYGDGPDSCDILGARDLWVYRANDSLFCMHYDAAGPKGWLAALATSKDLVHWEKKGPVLALGQKDEPDSRSASYGTTYFDGSKWHMFYLGTPNVTAAPDFIPSFPYLNMKAEANSPLGPWIKRKDIVPFTPKKGTFYSSTASPGFIVKNNDEYMMFFSAADYTIKRTICIARTKDLDSQWEIDSLPIVPPEEQIENTSLYFEESNQTWFLFTNHIGIDEDGEYTDAVWVYWTKDLNRWNPDNKAVVLDRENCKWSHRCIGLPSVIRYENRLAVLYDAPGDSSVSHMRRSIGLAFMNLPLNPPH